MIKKLKLSILFLLVATAIYAKSVKIVSPNEKVSAELLCNDDGIWYLKLSYRNSGKTCVAIPKINLGLVRSDQEFSNLLRFKKAGKPRAIRENYTTLHGKKLQRTNAATEVVVYFENPSKAKLNLIIRAYNDGLAFRYEFPEKKGEFAINDELTSYAIEDSTTRWLEKFDLSNEGLYHDMADGSNQQNWCYPALFKSKDVDCWYLIHEAGLDRSYCATKLSNFAKNNAYKVTLPNANEGKGEAIPTISLPWKSPWRVVILGERADIVESTLIDDVSAPSKVTNTDWIKPGLVSWNYWSDNHGTKDYQTVCKFADLAAEMNWPYTLLDWEWDAMENGGDVEAAAKYVLSKGVKPLIWYNSSMFKWITATPVDRMKTHENRVKEFTWLKKHGFVGVKIDFFLSEKQFMIQHYLDILEDAAEFEMLVYFHGCLVPRGWGRTYPHLMTYEGVRGAEWYNNNSELTTTAPEHNTVLPFTRNVVGSMDYTPVTFTNSQHPHTTSYAHELALSIVFESALQHMADRPEGYLTLPDAAKYLLREVPAAWDETKFIDGFPGKDVMMARRNGDTWFVAGINAEDKEKKKQLLFDFLPENAKYKLTLIEDGEHDKDFRISYIAVRKGSAVSVKLLRRGGFSGMLVKLD